MPAPSKVTSPAIHTVSNPTLWRAIAGGLYVFSVGSLAIIGVMILAGMFFSPPLLFRLVLVLAIVPGLAATLIACVVGVPLPGPGLSRWNLALKFGLFPLVATFIAFRLHQFIMYGGMLGQYHLHGLQAYLSTLAYHWIMVFMYLLIWASVLRALAEAIVAGTAWLVPARALAARTWAERGVNLCYYGGVVALVLLRVGL